MFLNLKEDAHSDFEEPRKIGFRKRLRRLMIESYLYFCFHCLQPKGH